MDTTHPGSPWAETRSPFLSEKKTDSGHKAFSWARLALGRDQITLSPEKKDSGHKAFYLARLALGGDQITLSPGKTPDSRHTAFSWSADPGYIPGIGRPGFSPCNLGPRLCPGEVAPACILVSRQPRIFPVNPCPGTPSGLLFPGSD